MNFFASVRSRQRHGFSLVELVVVLLILGILSTAAAPRYLSALSDFRASASAKRVKADLEMVRRQAKQTSAAQTVEFYVTEHRYTATDMFDLDHRSQTYEMSLDDPAYKSRLIAVDFGGASTVTFDIYGQPSNAGTVTVESGSRQRQVVVDANGSIALP